jgi:hypothetical protein
MSRNEEGFLSALVRAMTSALLTFDEERTEDANQPIRWRGLR